MKSFYSTRVIKLLLYDKQRGKCNGCRQPFAIGKMELDHIMPRAGGGADIPSNFQLLCKPCNRTKMARIEPGQAHTLFDTPRTPRISPAPDRRPPGSTAQTGAERTRAWRERLRAEGICTVCGKRKARKGKATCGPCNESAKERVKASRE